MFEVKLSCCTLGFIVGRDGIKPAPERIEAVNAWPAATTMKEVQHLLGLTNFFRKLILGHLNLAALMTELTKRIWTGFG